MNISRHLTRMASLFAVIAVGLVSVSAIAQGCPGKKTQFPESSPVSTTNAGGTSNGIRPEPDQNASRSGVTSNSDISASGEKTWKYAAIAVATAASGSMAFLLYKTWVSRRLSPVQTIHPELEHPELQLTSLPKEALAETSQLDDQVTDLEATLTR